VLLKTMLLAARPFTATVVAPVLEEAAMKVKLCPAAYAVVGGLVEIVRAFAVPPAVPAQM
jgi:hypothetical protein